MKLNIIVIDTYKFDNKLIKIEFSYKRLFSKRFLLYIFNKILSIVVSNQLVKINGFNKKKFIVGRKNIIKHIIFKDVFKYIFKGLNNKKIKKSLIKSSILILNGYLTHYKVSCTGRTNIVYYSEFMKKIVDSTIGGKTGPIMANFKYDGIFIYNSKHLELKEMLDLDTNLDATILDIKIVKDIFFFNDGFLYFESKKHYFTQNNKINHNSYHYNKINQNSKSQNIETKNNKVKNSNTENSKTKNSETKEVENIYVSHLISPLIKLIYFKESKATNKVKSKIILDKGISGFEYLDLLRFVYGAMNEKNRFIGKFGLGNSLIRNNISSLYFLNSSIKSLNKELLINYCRDLNINLSNDFEIFNNNIIIFGVEKNKIDYNSKFKKTKISKAEIYKLKYNKPYNKLYYSILRLNKPRFDKLRNNKIGYSEINYNRIDKNEDNKGKYNEMEYFINNFIIENINLLYKNDALNLVMHSIENMRFCPGFCIRFEMEKKKVKEEKRKHIRKKSEVNNRVNKDKNMDDLEKFVDKHLLEYIKDNNKNKDFAFNKNNNNFNINNKKVKSDILKYYKYNKFLIPDKVNEILEYYLKNYLKYKLENKYLIKKNSYIKKLYKKIYANKYKKKFYKQYKYKEQILNNLGLCVFTIFSMDFIKLKKRLINFLLQKK